MEESILNMSFSKEAMIMLFLFFPKSAEEQKSISIPLTLNSCLIKSLQLKISSFVLILMMQTPSYTSVLTILITPFKKVKSEK